MKDKVMGLDRESQVAFRCDMYRFLGKSLLEPVRPASAAGLSAGFWGGFAVPEDKGLIDAVAECGRVAERLEAMGQAPAMEAVNVEFAHLFVGPGKPSAPPWESLYADSSDILFGQATFDVRDAMRVAGLGHGPGCRQLEDHIGFELLLLAEQDVRDPAVARSSLRFVSEHPLTFVSQLREKAREHGPVGYYAALLGCARALMEWDASSLREMVDES